MDFNEALERFAQTDPAEVREEIAKDVEDQRVRLVQREDSGHQLLIYTTDRGVNVELPVIQSSFWATQQQMAELFAVTQQDISHHLGRIYADGELSQEATHKDYLLVQTEGTRKVRRERAHYNLDAVISVGYRVNSKQGTMFRIWATQRLVQILTKGFYVDV